MMLVSYRIGRNLLAAFQLGQQTLDFIEG